MKKCIICGKEAVYAIKGTTIYYCDECAKELFSDLSCLVRLDSKPKPEEEEVDSLTSEE